MTDRAPWLGIVLVGGIAAVATLAPLLAPQDPYASGIDMLVLPSAAHWLGTDDLGRDVLSRVIYGSRASLAIGFGAAVVAMSIGVPVGLVAGTLRGSVDIVLAALIDLFIALPGLVLALIITVMIGANLRNLILVLGFVMWPPIARLVRGQALAIREALFIEAARATGGRSLWIVRRHVWPNVLPVVAAQFSISVSFAIFTSSSLSFLGLGIPPPAPDWGGMVRAGYDYLALNPWISLAPGTAVSLTVMGFYLIGRSFR
ncbi:MAG: ABC transporter permease [Alphaproteobacteria bacterium]|nr:ABC transporter permease [Alphaproteobacteria bacterium]